MPARNPQSMVVEEAIETYFNKYVTSRPSPPFTLANRKQIASELMLHIAVPFEAANALLPAGSRYKIPRELPSNAVAALMLRLDDVKFIDFGQGSKDNNVPAVYMHEGPDKGIYSTLETEIKKRIRVYRPDANEKFTREVIDILRAKAEHVERYQDTGLVPVNNGLFDRRTKTLLPFTPDRVYVTKCRVDYKDNPSNPVFTAPDGSTWDVETWMAELSDNPEIVELLWQVLGATVRSGEPWDKIILLYSVDGSSGKSTLVELAKQLSGDSINMQLSQMSRKFLPEKLLTASAIFANENDVGEFIDKSSVLKALATNDDILFEMKYKSPVSFQFHGLIIQCLNSIPRFKDRSGSLYRRFLVIPFDKCFTGAERKYIKDDYLKRPEVLEYVLNKVLNMDFDELSEPAACKELLGEYKEYNDPVRQFAAEILPRCAWDLLPFTFLYELYKGWFKKNCPSGQMLSHYTFVDDLLAVLPDFPEWGCKDKKKDYRRKKLMDKPEPLILEYELNSWYNHSYLGPDPIKRCQPKLNDKYRGLLRVSTTAVINDVSEDDDSSGGDMDDPFAA